MTTWFVDSAAVGAANGSSWTDDETAIPNIIPIFEDITEPTGGSAMVFCGNPFVL